MTLTSFFNEAPLWFSIPVTIGYIAVAIIDIVLLVQLFRIKD